MYCLKRWEYRNFGLNFVWYIDVYDKLKLYGFFIYGCIDGFSRRVIWLKVLRINNDLVVIVGFYFEVVEMEGGCFVILRIDIGIENIVIVVV